MSLALMDSHNPTVQTLQRKNKQLRAEINEQARLLGISAEKELALRAENERLKAENELYAAEMSAAKEAGFYSAQELFMAYKNMEAKLAEKEAEILKLNQMYPATAYTVELEKQLAAALAACEAKDAEVKEMRSGDPEYVYYACKRILAIKPDAPSLKAHDEALIERCAEVCEEYVDRIEAKRDEEYQAEYAGRQAGATRCAAAIRELKERK